MQLPKDRTEGPHSYGDSVGDGDGGVAIASGAKEGLGKEEESAGPAGMLNLTSLQLGFSARWQKICQCPGFPCHVSRGALHTLPCNENIFYMATVVSF